MNGRESSASLLADGDEGVEVHEAQLLAERRQQMQEGEVALPFVTVGILVALVAFFMCVDSSRRWYLVPAIAMFAFFSLTVPRWYRVVRVHRVAPSHMLVESRGRLFVLRFADVANATVVPVGWDEGAPPFMKSVTKVVVDLASPAPLRRVVMLDGRDRLILDALERAGISLRSPRWARHLADEDEDQ